MGNPNNQTPNTKTILKEMGGYTLAALAWPLVMAIGGLGAFYQEAVRENAIDSALIRLVDTNKNGIIDPAEEETVITYLIDHSNEDDNWLRPDPFISNGKAHWLDHTQVDDIKREGVNTDLTYFLKEAYLSLRGIEKIF